jgi:pimeloyl-ACP methyl ester carboxylesterase
VVRDGAPYDVVGFSFGSIMGGHASIHLGERLKSLTLVGAGGMGLSRAPADEMVRLMPTMTKAELEKHARRNLEILMVAHPETVDDVAIHMQILNSMRAVARSRGISRAGTLKDVLPKIRTTLRGIWGELDSTSVGYLNEREELLRSIQPDIDFRVIPNAGHWVAYEAAGAFNAMVIDMLRPKG